MFDESYLRSATFWFILPFEASSYQGYAHLHGQNYVNKNFFQQTPNDEVNLISHFPELRAFSMKSQDIGVVFCILGILY